MKVIFSFLPRLLLGVSLFGGTSITLFAGDAKAQFFDGQICAFGSNPSQGGCTSAPYDSRPSATDKQITLLSASQDGTTKGPTSGIGATVFTEVQGIWLAGADFFGSAPAPGTFDYTITITDPNYYFGQALLTWSGIGSATKQFFTDATFTTPAQGFPTLTTNATDPADFVSLPSGFTTLYIRDSYTSGITNFYNGFTQAQVPAPLPVLGASAAFGFSRRLRRRIQQSQKKLG
jgi:hypothetical protein